MLSISLRAGLIACALAASACEFDRSGFDESPTGEDADGDRTGADAMVDGGAMLDASPAVIPDAALPDATAGCPADYTYERFTGTSYRTGLLALDWYGAEADCADDGVGTHLVVIEGEHELERLEDQLSGQQVWVGLTDTNQEDVFVWVTGEDAWFLPWHSGEPNDWGALGEDCVELAGGEYNDEPCATVLQRYVCECDGWVPDPDAWQ